MKINSLLAATLAFVLVAGLGTPALAGSEFSAGSCTCQEDPPEGPIFIVDFFCFVGSCAELEAECNALCGGILETSCTALQEPNQFCPVIPDIVGGEFLSIDSTALLLAGLQTSAIWMLPVLAGVAGSAFGILYIKSRRN